MNKIYLFFLRGMTILIFNSLSIGQTIPFFDDFESYIAGQRLACQNPIDWISIPCDPILDPLISSNHAYSGINSVVIVQNNDVVKLFGNQISGLWYISFQVYIPTGKAGYFNILAGYPPDPVELAMECWFDADGSGRLTNIPFGPVQFVYPNNYWFKFDLRVNLSSDLAEVRINNFLIHTWQWTLGATLRLAANDFNGVTVDNEMYIDDYWFGDSPVPVELISFTANVNNNRQVVLNWSTASELNNRIFEIERKVDNRGYEKIGYVNGNGTTTEPKDYSYVDQTVETGNYFYRLKQIDFNGSYEYSNEVEVEVNGPLTLNLAQNYPNPFNPSTSIKYSVPESGNIRLSVFNIVGEEVAVLTNGFSQAGTFEVTFDASNLSSGVYLYKLQSANSVQTKKMMLLK